MISTRLDEAFLARPIAHRGLHDVSAGVIENSESAIQAAIDAGYSIEIDVQLSGDQHPIVFHDYDLGRLSDARGYVREKSADELGDVVLCGSTDTIPTLARVLELVAGQVPLLIEIKDQDLRLGPKVGPLEQAIAALLQGYSGPTAVMSFNPHSVHAFAKYAPKLAIGLVTDAFLSDEWPLVPQERLDELAMIPDARGLGVDFVSHDHNDLESHAIAELKSEGMPILCWTVRSAADETIARQVAHQITFEGYRPAS